MSPEDVTLEAQSDKSDMRRSSGSTSFEKPNLYWSISSPLEAFLTELPWNQTQDSVRKIQAI